MAVTQEIYRILYFKDIPTWQLCLLPRINFCILFSSADSFLSRLLFLIFLYSSPIWQRRIWVTFNVTLWGLCECFVFGEESKQRMYVCMRRCRFLMVWFLNFYDVDSVTLGISSLLSFFSSFLLDFWFL